MGWYIKLLHVTVLLQSACYISAQSLLYNTAKIVYNNSQINIQQFECQEGNIKLTIQWLIRYSPCAEEYFTLSNNTLDYYWTNPMFQPVPGEYDYVEYRFSKETICKCSECARHLRDPNEQVRNDVQKCSYKSKKGNSKQCKKYLLDWDKINTGDTKAEDPERTQQTQEQQLEPPFADDENTAESRPKGRRKRSRNAEKVDTENSSDTKRDSNQPPPPAGVTNPPAKPQMKKVNHIDTVWRDGAFLFILSVSSSGEFKVNVSGLSIRSPGDAGGGGYLAATWWPMLPFYAVMCVVYVLYGAAWLVVSALQWRDLLRIQFWIGAVIILGMLEKAIFYAHFQHLNSVIDDDTTKTAIIFAELVSCLKKALARMLVIIVSLGFGIVKPRLGPMLHKVVGMGSLYFILAAIESCLRVYSNKEEKSNQEYLARIPLAVIDVAISYWVFSSLVQTMRTLRLRRNVVKLALYRHFTNTLIFAVVASVCFMIWSIKVYKTEQCLRDWQELWVDDAFWHVLFAIILLVIMILWRPTANNQRYAFKPLLDHEDDDGDEEDEVMMNDAYSVKQRMKSVNGTPRAAAKDPQNKIEDDLKWVEENIPSTVADAALPSLLDSDEEIMTTKTEMAKME